LLSKNGFEHAYLFSSITIFIALTLFCKKRWEFVTICLLNIAAIVTAYFTAPKLFISPGVLIILLLTFTFIAYVSFLVVMAYHLRFQKAVTDIIELNHSLMVNDEKLRQKRKHLNALMNSLNDVIFEFDEQKICLNTWFSTGGQRAIDPRSTVGKRLAEVLGAEKAKKFDDALDYVIKHKQSTAIKFLSDFGSNKWFLAKMAPVYDQNGEYTGRISASVTDISEQKKYADALKENEILLLEAQTISKTGNWWHDHQTKETYLSDNLYALLEIDGIPEHLNKFEYYMSLVHPDDRQSSFTYFTNVRNIADDKFEHRIITPNGNLKHIKVLKGSLLLDDEGEPKRISGVLQDVTEIKLSDKIIKVSQAELVEAQTIAKIGNWKWDVTLNKLSWSDEINNIFEVNKKGDNDPDFIALLKKYIHPDDRLKLKGLLKNAGKATGSCYECRIITINGHTKYLSIIIGKLIKRENGTVRKIIGTLQDVTDRKQAELDFRRTEDKYRLVLETIKLPAISLNNKGELIFCNKYMANLLGYGQTEILGLNWVDNFVPQGVKSDLTEWFNDDAFKPQNTNLVVCRNGGQRTISWQNTISYDEKGHIKEITSIGEDITERQKATQELISAKEEAEKSSKFKSEFLSIMSHEIRTPMNAVIGTTNLLLSESPKPDQVEYLNTLKFSGENLLAIINDILDYNKIEAGKLTLNEIPFNIHHLIQKIKQSFYPKAIEKGIEINLLMDDTIPEYLTGDQVRISQILNNLLSNAVKFTHSGTVTIKLSTTTIDNKQVTVQFTIEDTGIGMAAENLAIIFDPFTQEKGNVTENYGGTGLGLAITKRLVNLHRSDISVLSEPGKGSQFTFSISFLLAPHEQDLAQQLPPFLSGQTPPHLQGMRVLIVDDNKMNLLIASKFLKKWRAETDEALNGELALEMVNNNKYDVIIMDLQMPVMDGFEAARSIRISHPDIPIIALTADAMPETHQKAFAAGMCDYLTKPFAPEILYGKVAKHYVSFEAVA
jgi:two-component system sensor histidine kinase/response regulator